MSWYCQLKTATFQFATSPFGYWVTPSSIIPVAYQGHNAAQQPKSPQEAREMMSWIRVRFAQEAVIQCLRNPTKAQVDMLESIMEYHKIPRVNIEGGDKPGMVDFSAGDSLSRHFGLSPNKPLQPDNYHKMVNRGLPPSINKEMDRANWRNRSGD